VGVDGRRRWGAGARGLADEELGMVGGGLTSGEQLRGLGGRRQLSITTAKVEPFVGLISKVQKFFDMLRGSKEPLHEHMIVSILTFMTRLMTIKSRFTFSNKCYKELLCLFSDFLPNNHKMLKVMYQSKQIVVCSRYGARED
jgi:hypothetical protein